MEFFGKNEPQMTIRPLNRAESLKHAAIADYVTMMEDRGYEGHEDLYELAQVANNLTAQYGGDHSMLIYNTTYVLNEYLLAGYQLTQVDADIVHEIGKRIYFSQQVN